MATEISALKKKLLCYADGDPTVNISSIEDKAYELYRDNQISSAEYDELTNMIAEVS